MRGILIGFLVAANLPTAAMAAPSGPTPSKVIGWPASACVVAIESVKAAAQKAGEKVIRATFNTVVVKHKDGIFEHVNCGVTFDNEDLSHATIIRSFSSTAFELGSTRVQIALGALCKRTRCRDSFSYCWLKTCLR